jgi:hypothetical protein
MIGTSFAWVTSSLAATGLFAGSPPAQRVAFSAAIVGTFVYLAGLILSTWLPEPRPEQMAD